MTFEQYYAIVYPLHHSLNFKSKHVSILMMLAWVIGIGFQASWKIPTTNSNGKSCATCLFPNTDIRQAVNGMVLLLEYFLPLFAISFAYISIFIKLKEPKDVLKSKEKTNNQRHERMKRARLNVIKTLFRVFACFVICWTPNIALFTAVLLFKTLFHPYIYHTFVVLCFANSCINPFIYTFTYTHFQKELFSVFCGCSGKHQENSLSKSQEVGSGHGSSQFAADDTYC